jgi:PDZ domain-containing protein
VSETSPPVTTDPGGARHVNPGGSAARIDPRTTLMIGAGFTAVLLAALLTILPTSYVVLRPGPVFNTLNSVGRTPLISVTGHASYPAKGQLDMTTVSLSGGPGQHVSLWQVLAGWLDRTASVVPEDEVFPRGQTAQQTEDQDTQEMVSSQESATVAAMSLLGIEVPTTLKVSEVDAGAPAASAIRAGDVILAIDGEKTQDLAKLRTALQKVTAGQPTTVTISRNGAQQKVTTRTTKGSDGRTVLGVFIDPSFQFPFQVKISIDNIVGPSAGMMFALGIADVLTPGDLTGGKQIAGTGTIDADGSVGPIGGIQQKMIGARQAGAAWFLAPAGNCAEVVGHVPNGMQVVRVATLEQARTAVEAIASGTGTASLPACGR